MTFINKNFENQSYDHRSLRQMVVTKLKTILECPSYHPIGKKVAIQPCHKTPMSSPNAYVTIHHSHKSRRMINFYEPL